MAVILVLEGEEEEGEDGDIDDDHHHPVQVKHCDAPDELGHPALGVYLVLAGC